MMRPCLSRCRPGEAAAPGDPARASGECGGPGRAGAGQAAHAGDSRPLRVPGRPSLGPLRPLLHLPRTRDLPELLGGTSVPVRDFPSRCLPVTPSLISRDRARMAALAFCLTLGRTPSSRSRGFRSDKLTTGLLLGRRERDCKTLL